MKKLLRKLRALDDLELVSLREAVHGEIARRHPERGAVVKTPQLRVVSADDADDEPKPPRPSRRKRSA